MPGRHFLTIIHSYRLCSVLAMPAESVPWEFLSSGNKPSWHQRLPFINEPLLRKQLRGSSHWHCGLWDPDKWPLRSLPTVFAQPLSSFNPVQLILPLSSGIGFSANETSSSPRHVASSLTECSYVRGQLQMFLRGEWPAVESRDYE